MTHPDLVKVEVVCWAPAGGTAPDSEPDTMQPASPRHATARGTWWERTVTRGHEALATSSEAIAVEVDAVAERMMAALEQRHSDRAAARVSEAAPDPLWRLNEVEVTFGVQLTGEATIAVFSATSESSAQIVLKFTRA